MAGFLDKLPLPAIAISEVKGVLHNQFVSNKGGH